MVEKNSEIVCWLDVLKELSNHNVDFFVVGGAALVLHGIPRTTLDIDIYIPAEKNTITSVCQVLSDKLKLESSNPHITELLEHADLLAGQWIAFSTQGNQDVVDVFFESVHEFYETFIMADDIELEGRNIKVANLDTIKQLKRNCGRPIDMADIALIEEFEKM